MKEEENCYKFLTKTNNNNICDVGYSGDNEFQGTYCKGVEQL